MQRLPVVGSTAKSTAFVHARLDGPGGLHLFFDGNGKITAGNGTLHEPKPNAFSLLDEPSALYKAPEQHGMLHCPGSTPTCRKACYVQNLKAAQPELHAMYAHNSETIRRIVDNGPAEGVLWDGWMLLIAEWIRENAAEGFRWHVSGDVFSLAYANFIAGVCMYSPGVKHWIYTRSFAFLEPLIEVSTLYGGNLALNLSADKDNYSSAILASLQCTPGMIRICYLVTEPNEDLPPLLDYDVIFPDYTLRPRQHATLAESEWWQKLTPHERGLVCPVDAHGKAENRRCGPCSRCLT